MNPKELIERYFHLETAPDALIKSYSTDHVKVTCKECHISIDTKCKTIYSYIKNALDNQVSPCRYCSKTKCRDLINQHYTILTTGKKLTSNSNDEITVKCNTAGHEFVTTPHKLYVSLTASTTHKCPQCKKTAPAPEVIPETKVEEDSSADTPADNLKDVLLIFVLIEEKNEEEEEEEELERII